MFGAVLIVGLFLTTGAPILLLIGLMALPRLFNRKVDDERPLLEPAAQRVWAFRYFGLASLLAAGSYFASEWMQDSVS
jgi:hypothetical protein